MGKDITRTVEALCASDDPTVSATRSEIEARLSVGEFGWTGDLGLELVDRIADGGDRRGHCTAVLNRVLYVLAERPEPESLRALLRVLASPHRDGLHHALTPRLLAAVVADRHRIEDIVPVVFDAAPRSPSSLREFSACLLHQLVLVSDAVEGYPALRAFARTLLAEGHPLAALPLTLLPEERGIRRPPGAADDWSWQVRPTLLRTDPLDPPPLESTPSMRQRVADIDVTETDLPAMAELSGAAVRHWRDQSNGRIAAQEFWLLDPVTEADLPALFERLPLTPWPADGTPATLYPASPDVAFRVLLTAAACSPAYGSGLHGAYGRLAAWRSLAGLTGSAADVPLTQVAELVRHTGWFRVDTTSPWFHEVLWDLGLAALRPGGREVAVLAATDTD
ncbi:hypothetical protein GCM10009665_76690 [Kitasatospora nipponensis]|uniref:Uncharacterized protein n=1 Tax=Kitasatospora nipponensis TaxID=258049 RepID=A0ABN1T8Q3_9ACTN